MVKSKKYLLPIAVLNPEFAGGLVVAYLAGGHLRMPKNADTFDVDDVGNDEVKSSSAKPETVTSPDRDRITDAPAAGSIARHTAISALP